MGFFFFFFLRENLWDFDMYLILGNSMKDQSELIKNNHIVYALICKTVYQPLKLINMAWFFDRTIRWLYSACYLDHCELRCIL